MQLLLNTFIVGLQFDEEYLILQKEFIKTNF